MGFGSLGDDYRRRMASGRRTVGRPRSFAMSDVISFGRDDLAFLENNLWTAGKKGKRAVRNAHKATLDELNETARKIIGRAQFGQSRQRFRRGGGQRTTWTYKKKERKILAFRKGVQRSGSWSFQSKMTSDGVVSRSWLNPSQYLNYLGPMWENGFVPARGTKFQGSPVKGLRWRYGPARTEGTNRRVRNRMEEAILIQMAEGRTMTPKELRRAVR